jgi:hypothetical protein
VESGITFNIIDTATGLSLGTAIDGYIASTSSNASVATFSSLSFNFGSILDLTGKILQIHHPANRNNSGNFNITSYDGYHNSISILASFNNLNQYNVSAIRIKDNKDLWSTSTCVLDTVNNLLNFPATTLAAQGDEVVVLLFTNQNLHQEPTKLSVTVADQTNNTGIITIAGTTVTQVASVVFSAINNGLKQNLLSAMKTFLNLTSTSIIGANNYLVRIAQVQKVSTDGNIVLTTLADYDVLGTQLANNLLYENEMVYNGSLSNMDFMLPSTTNNLNNSPIQGDQLQITFYYATDNNYENLYFTRNGQLYTNNKFAFIEQIYISSGFSSSTSANLTFAYFTQPITGSRYTAYYNYLAPKQNEQILINYNYNQLITAATFAIENQRPINADVLVKAAVELLIDVTMNIVVTSVFAGSAITVQQNVQSAISNIININALGGILSSSQCIAAAQGVSGVESAQIIGFNIDGVAGQVLIITAQSNQYFVANNIIVNLPTNG